MGLNLLKFLVLEVLSLDCKVEERIFGFVEVEKDKLDDLVEYVLDILSLGI